MSEDYEEMTPENAMAVLPNSGFKEADPEAYRLVEDVEALLKQDMLPGELQEKLFSAFNPAVKRNIITQESGLDAGILSTFKSQLNLVDAILRRTFNDDGSVKGEDLAMEPKDVLSLSLRVSQMMVKELPKVYNMDRIQRMESSILDVIQEHLTRDQQDAFILALEERSSKL